MWLYHVSGRASRDQFAPFLFETACSLQSQWHRISNFVLASEAIQAIVKGLASNDYLMDTIDTRLRVFIASAEQGSRQGLSSSQSSVHQQTSQSLPLTSSSAGDQLGVPSLGSAQTLLIPQTVSTALQPAGEGGGQETLIRTQTDTSQLGKCFVSTHQGIANRGLIPGPVPFYPHTTASSLLNGRGVYVLINDIGLLH